MMNPKLSRSLRNLLPFIRRDASHHNQHRFHHFQSRSFTLHNPTSSSFFFLVFGFRHTLHFPLIFSPSFDFSFPSLPRYSTTTTNASSSEDIQSENPHELAQSDTDEVEPIDLWEEEDEAEPKIGDGGDGGGVVLQNCSWAEKVLSIARDVLLQFGDDIEIFAFKTSPRGYIYVRLDRLCNEYGCPSMEDIQSYSHEYKRRLDEAGAVGDIPSDLALEVSSPGADRLLRIPNDLERFKEMAMRVKYVERDDPRSVEKEGVFFLESMEVESGSCIWRLADVKENRDPSSKGRPFTRKQKDWRLELPFEMIELVTLYLDYQ
ncbi:hypothetical protein L6452_17919 [Arctium lappa]|uniref:Uncharacterized protein n=1 Tax=Arctium lappa TaxID=4217 RepID=A0ACB9C4T7_ARCLA|nr:hypothetical protein L6452_17919 [Arctium lappa]